MAEPTLTRDQFIDAYMARSNIDPALRTKDGFRRGKRRCRALPCACGDEICQGWAMIGPYSIADHLRFNAPKEKRHA
jgi:hypothetical protein